MNLSESVTIGNLIDVYGSMLTERQLMLLKSYYFDNFSLGEIASNHNITRQAVNFSIKNAVTSLKKWDAKLNLLEKYELILQKCENIVSVANCDQVSDLANKIVEIVND